MGSSPALVKVSSVDSDQFNRLGYLGPVPVLSAEDRRSFLAALADPNLPPPLDWNKGQAVTSHIFFEVARHPAIVDRVSELLGPDVMLWGASLQDRAPGAVHPWHSDIETSLLPEKTVTVWVGLQHTTRDSSLQIIPYSHRFGVTVQELRYEAGRERDEVTDDEIAAWARMRDPQSHVLRLDMTDGEAVFVDGQLWHGSRNLSTETRRALLLQYATPDALIRIPDLNYLDWPFRQFSFPRPACLMVRGSTTLDINRIVSPPVVANSVADGPRIQSGIHPIQLPLEPDPTEGWKPYFLFHGSTPELSSLSCHVSVLKPGCCPHSPHTHDEEELLLLLSGEVELTLPDGPDRDANHRRRLHAGEFVYYPLKFSHTLQTVSDEPANYLMFKWQNRSRGEGAHLKFGQFSFLAGSSAETGFTTKLVFEGSTPYLSKLHCHTSMLTPQAGYEPHIDSHDVGIIVLEGEVETLGQRVGPHGVIFCPSGELHGMRNPGEVVAKYVVFEFHGNRSGLLDERPSQPPLIALQTNASQRGGLKRLWRRFIGKRSTKTH